MAFLIAIGFAIGAAIAGAGQTSSKNTVKTMTDINMSIMTEFALDCSTSLSQENVINATDDCSISLEDTDLTNTAYVDKSCLLSASNISQMEVTSAEQMTQMAEAIAQQFALSSAKAENLYDSTFILSQDIVNTFTLDCSETLYQQNSVTCSGQGNVTLKGVTLENFVDIEANCVLDVLNSSEAAADIVRNLDQGAKAKQESKFAGLLIPLLAVIALIVIVLIIVKSRNSTSSGPGSSKAIIGVAIGVFVLIVFIVLLYTKKSASKSKYPNPKTTADPAA